MPADVARGARSINIWASFHNVGTPLSVRIAQESVYRMGCAAVRFSEFVGRRRVVINVESSKLRRYVVDSTAARRRASTVLGFCRELSGDLMKACAYVGPSQKHGRAPRGLY